MHFAPSLWHFYSSIISSCLFKLIFILCLNSMSALLLDLFVALLYSIISPQLPGSWRAPLRDSAQLLLGLRNNAFARSRVDVWKVIKSQCRSPSVSRKVKSQQQAALHESENLLHWFFLARPEVATGEPAPLPSGLISLSCDNKMGEKKNNACAGSLLLLWIDPLLDGGKTWMEREFFDVL